MMHSRIAGVVRWSGGTILLRMGQSIDNDHPLVDERPDLFEEKTPGASIKSHGPSIERATRAPGEVRTTPETGPRANRVPKGGSAQ